MTDEAKDPQGLQERLDSIAYLLDRADRCQVLRQLMAENERLRAALEIVAFVRHKKVVAGRCPGCRRIAERILAGATIEAALDGAHVPDEEVLR